MIATPQEDNARSVLSIIRAIQSGEVDPRKFSKEQRQPCVEHLWTEGYSIVETAEILKVTERTICRDRREIQQHNALEHDPKLLAMVAGRIWQEVEISIAQIRRVCRDKATPAHVKVEGGRCCVQIIVEKAKVLQSLGYLPTAAQRLDADVTHHLGSIPEYEQIAMEIEHLGTVAQAHPDPSARQEVQVLKDQLTRASLGAGASKLVAELSTSQKGEADAPEP